MSGSWGESIKGACGKPEKLSSITVAVYGETGDMYGATSATTAGLPDAATVMHVKDGLKCDQSKTEFYTRGVKIDNDKFTVIQASDRLIAKKGEGGVLVLPGKSHTVVARCEKLDVDKGDMLGMSETILNWAEPSQ